MRKYVFTLLALLLFVSSCSLTAVKSRKTFVINPIVSYTAENRSGKMLKVEAINCAAMFNSTLFYYKKGRYEFEPYATVGWLEPPCSMVKSLIINSIEKSGMFKFVNNGNILTVENYRLLFSIKDLEPVFEKKHDYILINIYFALMDSNKKTIIGSYSFKRKFPIKNIQTGNIVNKINLSLKLAVESMLEWLDASI